MIEDVQLRTGDSYELELTCRNDRLTLATDVGLPDDCSLIVDDVPVADADYPIRVDATVEKCIRSDGELDYVVLDVASVPGHSATTDAETRTESRSSGRQRSSSLNMTAERRRRGVSTPWPRTSSARCNWSSGRPRRMSRS